MSSKPENKSKVISWSKNLNAELDANEFFDKAQGVRQFVRDSLVSQNVESELFCGASGTFEDKCKVCNKFSICYDQHCIIDEHNYKIDFVIKKFGFDLFVMIDDDFWHGLLRPLELLKNPQCELDNIVSEVFFRDKYFNEHCKEKNIPLVRFSSRDLSLFFMSRIDHIAPRFSCGPKRKLSKFFKLYMNAFDLFFGELFTIEKRGTKRAIK